MVMLLQLGLVLRADQQLFRPQVQRHIGLQGHQLFAQGDLGQMLAQVGAHLAGEAVRVFDNGVQAAMFP